MNEVRDEVVGEILTQSASEFRAKLTEFSEVAKSKKIAQASSRDFLEKIENFLSSAIKDSENQNLSKEEALKRALDNMKTVSSYVKNARISMLEEAAKAQGIHDGAALVVKALEEIGNARIREGKRVAELAASDANLEGRRKIGERPETLRVKRKVDAARNSSSETSQEPENTDMNS